jgi:tetratricopeptide (TPR) repeat protein
MANAPLSESTEITPATVMQSLGASIFGEECKGDFAQAAGQADVLLAVSHTPEETADALILRGDIHLLQGEPARAAPLLERALRTVPNDTNRTLRALSSLLLATHQRYNAFPDGNGVGADEVSVRWQGAQDLLPIDSRWQEARQSATDPNAQFEAWLIYSFLAQLQPQRYMIEGARFTPSTLSPGQLRAMVTGPASQLYQMATAAGVPGIAAFADWAAADLLRRSGDLTTARTLLERARTGYRTAGDQAGEALCLMTSADWDTAPFSSPLVWNLADWDSSSASSALSDQVEAAEFTPGVTVTYDEAEALYRAAEAPRGLAAIQLRRGYLAMLRDEWADAANYACAARDAFSACGDRRGQALAATHVLMCQLCGADIPGLDPVGLAREIGAWDTDSGSFSFALGLGILVNRLSRHWLLRRGHYERALACSRAALTLFEALGARINATQCRVDQGLIHQAVGERTIALILFERALDDYTALADAYPAVTDNLRQRAVFLTTNLYQLALQQTDPDGMEQMAARLTRQLDWLPALPTDLDTQTDLLNTPADGQPDTAALTPGGSTPALPDPALVALRPMIADLVAQSAVLAPLYRARSLRARGDRPGADRSLEQATAALPSLPVGEQYRLHGVLLAERGQFPEAAEAIRRHLAAGGANAGFTGRLTELMKITGGDAGASQAALQERRTHEQAFSAFVMVRAYADAYDQLRALEALAGPEWWRADAKPWQPLCDIGEVYEAHGETQRALDCYDRAIAELEVRRASLSRDELKVALASDKGGQYLYFLAACAAVRTGDAARGFAYAERGKARALLDLMSSSRLPAESVAAPGTLGVWREAAMQLRLHQGLLAQARAQHPPTRDRIQTLEVQVTADETRLQAAEQDLAQANPRFHETVSRSATPLDAGAVARLLPPDTLLIEYFFLREDLLIWVIAPGAPPAAHWQACDVAALSRAILTLHRACARREPYADQAEELAQMLLAPVAVRIRASKQLLIVPHGVAHALPSSRSPSMASRWVCSDPFPTCQARACSSGGPQAIPVRCPSASWWSETPPWTCPRRMRRQL